MIRAGAVAEKHIALEADCRRSPWPYRRKGRRRGGMSVGENDDGRRGGRRGQISGDSFSVLGFLAIDHTVAVGIHHLEIVVAVGGDLPEYEGRVMVGVDDVELARVAGSGDLGAAELAVAVGVV